MSAKVMFQVLSRPSRRPGKINPQTSLHGRAIDAQREFVLRMEPEIVKTASDAVIRRHWAYLSRMHQVKLYSIQAKPVAGDSDSSLPPPGAQLLFQRRWYDTQFKRWDPWTTMQGQDLLKYGELPENWMSMAKVYISMGATYEYRIIERVDTVAWLASYLDKTESSNANATS